MKLYAHRGNCREALENSWQAFKLTKELGCTGFELDVHLTKDHEMVVIHDPNLQRTTLGNGNVYQMTKAQLKNIKLKNNEDIPFLEDVLDEFLPHMEINVELKTYTRPMVERFSRYFNNSPYQDRILLSAKSFRCLQHVNDLMPKCRTGYVLDTKKIFLPLSLLQRITDLVSKRVRLEAVNPIISLCQPDFVNFFKSRGIKVNFWYPLAWEKSLPDPFWEKLLNCNADAIISNEPRALSAWLKKHQ